MVAEALPCLERFSLKLFIADLTFCSIYDAYYNILGLQNASNKKSRCSDEEKILDEGYFFDCNLALNNIDD